MPKLNLSISITAQNRARRQLRQVRDDIRGIERASSSTARAQGRIAASTREHARQSRRVADEQRKTSRQYTRQTRQAKALTLEEAKRRIQIREQNKLMNQRARKALGLGQAKRGFDPDAPATNLQIAGSTLQQGGDATLRGLKSLTDATLEYGRAVSEVSTLTDNISRQELEDLTQAAAVEFGTAPVEQARALYQVISAGNTDVAAATDMLTEANRVAVAGVTDTTSAFDALNAVMKPYGMEAADAAHASDLLFQTVAAGKTTIPELSANLSKITPVAAAAGISIEEVLASISAITATTGAGTDEASTQIAGAFAKTIKSSKMARTEFKRLRKGSDELKKFGDIGEAVDQLGLVGLIQELEKSSKFSDKSFGRIFEDVRALKGVLTLSGPAAKTFGEHMDGLAQSTGASGRALDKMMDDPAKKLEKLNAEFEVFKIEAGEALLPLLRDVAQTIGPIIRDVTKFIRENPELTKIALGALAAGAVASSVTGRGLQAAAGMAALTGGQGFGAFAGGGGVFTSPGGGNTVVPGGGGQGAGFGRAAGVAMSGVMLAQSAAVGFAIGTAIDSIVGETTGKKLSDWIAQGLGALTGVGNTTNVDSLNVEGQGPKSAQERLAAVEADLAEREGLGIGDAIGLGVAGILAAPTGGASLVAAGALGIGESEEVENLKIERDRILAEIDRSETGRKAEGTDFQGKVRIELVNNVLRVASVDNGGGPIDLEADGGMS